MSETEKESGGGETHHCGHVTNNAHPFLISMTTQLKKHFDETVSYLSLVCCDKAATS